MNVEQLRQLEQAATEGEWLAHSGIVYRHACDGYSHDAHVRPCRVADCWDKDDEDSGRRQGTRDARLIEAARNALPALLDIAEELRGVLAAGQLPEAETGIFADMFARLDTEDQR